MATPQLFRAPHRRAFSSLPGILISVRPCLKPTSLFEKKITVGSTGWRVYSERRFRDKTEKWKLPKKIENSDLSPALQLDLSKAKFGTDKIENLPLVTEKPLFREEVKKDGSDEDEEVEDAQEEEDDSKGFRLPRAIQAAYLDPLRRKATYHVPVCDLQLRSYNARNLELMADMALRAAYFLDLPASGPVALPRIIERWTIPKAHFIHKKIQENYERKTLRRLIQIKDGDPEVVRIWLGFLRKHAYYGVGMKANVWEFAGIDVAKDMDAALQQNSVEIEPILSQYAFKNGSKLGEELIETVHRENRWQSSGGSAPMISTPNWRKPLN